MWTTDATLTAYSATPAAPAPRADRDRLKGLVLMAVVPAIFWAAMLALIGPWFGFAPSLTTLAITATGIGGFLASVCCAITSEAR